uniref:HTH CENPB-type domain-containing protein n=1 Tax=Globisporangium ultimum (strain ATCC 200006 / CBS 805.95 / DAOM BR144) TaxID=431595 RepID=K3WA50_GLOUD
MAQRRQNLSAEQRQQICVHSDTNPKMTQQALALWAKDAFGMAVEPSQSAISAILKRGRDAKTSGASADGVDGAIAAYAGGVAAPPPVRKVRKKRSVKYPKLDDALLKWVLDCDQHDIRISGELVKQKAEAFCDKLKIAKDARPNFSNGWLASFNRRHGLKRYKRDQAYWASEHDDDENDDDEYDGRGWKHGQRAKNPRFSISKDVNGESKLVELENQNGATALPWNELTEEELEARKREADLRIEGLRYDNSLKRIKVAEENMLARKRLKDAGIPQEEIDRMMPLAPSTVAETEI